MDRLKAIMNGAKAAPTFSAAEMAGRLERLRQQMAAADIEAVLLTSYHNVNYFADFLYCAFGRPYGLVVTQDKATTISANIDGGQPWRRSFGDNLKPIEFKRAVRRDLDDRRDLHCPPLEEAAGIRYPPPPEPSSES